VVCLQETKDQGCIYKLADFFLVFFGSDYDKFVALPASCTHGGILIAWKSYVCQAIASHVDVFSVVSPIR
jgi:hypothetical protein